MKKFIIFSLISLFFMPLSFAANCVSGVSVSDTTSFVNALCPVFTALNVAITFSGVVFGIFVVYSGVKFSMALGDPKGFAGAKQTLLYALFGFSVVMGFFAILTIVSNLFGISGFSGPDAVTSAIQGKINDVDALIKGR